MSISKFFFTGIFLFTFPAAAQAQGKFYLTANGTFALGLIYNHGVGFTGKGLEGPTLRPGYRSEIGLGRTFLKEKVSVEVGFGIYNMNNHTDVSLLGLLEQGEDFSFDHEYFSGSIRLGYVFATSKKFNLELVGGGSILLNREDTYFDGTWKYPDNSAWSLPDDLNYGRYSARESYNTHMAFTFHGGLRLTYSLTDRLQLRSMLFTEKSFKTIRSVLYSAERDYIQNEDLNYQILSRFSGEAVGLQLGIKYSL